MTPDRPERTGHRFGSAHLITGMMMRVMEDAPDSPFPRALFTSVLQPNWQGFHFFPRTTVEEASPGWPCTLMCKHTQMLVNTQMCSQFPMKICVHTPRFALCQTHAQPSTRTAPQTPQFCVLQLLPCRDLGATKGVAVGAGAAMFPVPSGLAVRATTSNHGHPVLPRQVAATAVSAKMLCQLPGASCLLGPLESRASPWSHTGVLLTESGQTPLGDLRELRPIPASICRKLDALLQHVRMIPKQQIPL